MLKLEMKFTVAINLRSLDGHGISVSCLRIHPESHIGQQTVEKEKQPTNSKIKIKYSYKSK